MVHDSWVSTDPRRLERILGNLLGNAAKHGAGPVEVTVEGRVVRVRDHGPGFPEALVREGPSRFRTGSSDRSGHGHGLGLTIAAGQARVLGARLTFRNAGPAGVPAAWGHGRCGRRAVAARARADEHRELPGPVAGRKGLSPGDEADTMSGTSPGLSYY